MGLTFFFFSQEKVLARCWEERQVSAHIAYFFGRKKWWFHLSTSYTKHWVSVLFLWKQYLENTNCLITGCLKRSNSKIGFMKTDSEKFVWCFYLVLKVKTALVKSLEIFSSENLEQLHKNQSILGKGTGCVFFL